MKVLLHVCCGPCAIVPAEGLREEGAEVRGVFFNPNVHPFTEWERRRAALADFAADEGLPLLPAATYDPTEWLRSVAFREGERCRVCYHLRLRHAARLARRGRFDAFSTTLLYSRFQQHDLVREIGEAAGREAGVAFLYRDWRGGWSRGVEESKRRGLYRQSYCGCLLSEWERFGSRRGARP
jgi:predicted adenine nucleotide alpha hydrolase (AANH) superfamily ATPase